MPATLKRIRFERDSWHGWTARTAQALAGELQANPAGAFALFDAAVLSFSRQCRPAFTITPRLPASATPHAERPVHSANSAWVAVRSSSSLMHLR